MTQWPEKTTEEIDDEIRREIGEETDNLSWLFEKGRPKYRLIMDLPLEYRRMIFEMIGMDEFKKEFLRLYNKAMKLKIKISGFHGDGKSHRSGAINRFLANIAGISVKCLRNRLFRK